jgi:hypothetical protein
MEGKTRAWYEVRPDRLIHGFCWFTDEQVLARIERGERWLPVLGAERIIETIHAELQGAEK